MSTLFHISCLRPSLPGMHHRMMTTICHCWRCFETEKTGDRIVFASPRSAFRFGMQCVHCSSQLVDPGTVRQQGHKMRPGQQSRHCFYRCTGSCHNRTRTYTHSLTLPRVAPPAPAPAPASCHLACAGPLCVCEVHHRHRQAAVCCATTLCCCHHPAVCFRLLHPPRPSRVPAWLA